VSVAKIVLDLLNIAFHTFDGTALLAVLFVDYHSLDDKLLSCLRTI